MSIGGRMRFCRPTGRGVVIVNKAMVMVTSFRRCCSCVRQIAQPTARRYRKPDEGRLLRCRENLDLGENVFVPVKVSRGFKASGIHEKTRPLSADE